MGSEICQRPLHHNQAALTVVHSAQVYLSDHLPKQVKADTSIKI